MGRRAKNKQGDPIPFHDDTKFFKPEKRKANDEDEDEKNDRRSPKKPKSTTSVINSGQKKGSTNEKEKNKGEGSKKGKGKGKGKKKKTGKTGSDNDSLGWEDVEDDENLQAHAT